MGISNSRTFSEHKTSLRRDDVPQNLLVISGLGLHRSTDIDNIIG